MRHLFILATIVLIYINTPFLGIAQTDSVFIEGYTYETNNRGFLRDVSVKIKSPDGFPYGIVDTTDRTGKFVIKVPKKQKYIAHCNKQGFHKKQIDIEIPEDTKANGRVYAKVEMERLPGYLLEVSITDFVDPNDPESLPYGIEETTIEIYNNTLQKEELRIIAHPYHTFSFLLEQGNEYIFMLRKEGYYTKRMRANVNVNGCILCMEGFGTVTPGVVENLTKNNTMGTLSANVSMKKLLLNEIVKMESIYYDFGKASIRDDAYPQLDLLAEMLQDNPKIVIEMGSHTDCRGSDKNNLELSQKRAENVVRYIRKKGKIAKDRITAKGYGEEKPLNSCVDGVECAEELHQQNRRTEFTVIDIRREDPYKDRTLASIMQEQNFGKILDANQESYFEEQVPDSSIVNTTKEPTPPKVIPLQYNGFKLQLLTERLNPTLDHFIFSEYNEVFLDVTDDEAFAFLIGDFKEETEAKKMLKQYIKQYPDAVIIEYKGGIRQ